MQGKERETDRQTDREKDWKRGRETERERRNRAHTHTLWVLSEKYLNRETERKTLCTCTPAKLTNCFARQATDSHNSNERCLEVMGANHDKDISSVSLILHHAKFLLSVHLTVRKSELHLSTWQTETQTYNRLIDRQKQDRQKYRREDRQTEGWRQTNRIRTDRKTEGWRDRQTDIFWYISTFRWSNTK